MTSMKIDTELKEKIRGYLLNELKNGKNLGSLRLKFTDQEMVEYLFNYRMSALFDLKREIGSLKLENVKESQLVVLNADLQIKLQRAQKRVEELENENIKNDKEIRKLKREQFE